MTDIALGSDMAMEWLIQILILNGRLLLLLAISLFFIRQFNASAARRHLLIAATFCAAFLLPFSTQWIPPLEIVMPVEIPLSSNRINSATSITNNGVSAGFWSRHWPIVLLCGYGAVALLLIGRLLFGNLRILQLYTLAHRHSLRAWRLSLRDCAHLLDVKQNVDIRHSPAINSPITWGVQQPVVLIPSAALQWPENLRRSALLHELAHIKRKDCFSKQAAAVICALYWLNPLCWLAFRQLNNDAETASDDTALGSGIRYSHYAQNLVSVAKQVNRDGPLPAGALSMVALDRDRNRSQFGQRVMAILNPDGCRTPINWTYLIAAFLFVYGVLLPVSSLRASVVQEIRYVVDPATKLTPMPPPVDNNRLTNMPLATSLFIDETLDSSINGNPLPPALTVAPAPNTAPVVEYREIPTAEVLAGVKNKVKNTLANIRKDSADDKKPATRESNQAVTTIDEQSHALAVDAISTGHEINSSVSSEASGQPLNLANLFYHHEQKHMFAEAPQPSINGSRIEPYVAKHMVTPHYPRRAQHRGIEGELTVEFSINRVGQVVDAKIINAQPQGVFDRAVLKALQKSRYRPQKIDGKAVAVSGVQEKYVFVLES